MNYSDDLDRTASQSNKLDGPGTAELQPRACCHSFASQSIRAGISLRSGDRQKFQRRLPLPQQRFCFRWRRHWLMQSLPQRLLTSLSGTKQVALGQASCWEPAGVKQSFRKESFPREPMRFATISPKHLASYTPRGVSCLSHPIMKIPVEDLLGQTAGIRKSSAALDVAYPETVWQRVTPLESPPLPLNTDP